MADKKRWWLRIAVFGAVLLAAYFTNVQVQTYLGERALSETGLQVRDLESALAAAKTDSKYVLADLAAIWCPACRRLDRTVFSDQGVKARIERDFVFARIEYESEQGRAFMERYQVSGFPNLLILDSDGKLIKKLPVTFDPEEFSGALDL